MPVAGLAHTRGLPRSRVRALRSGLSGLYNLNSEFDTTQSGGLFLISSHGIGPDFSQSGRRGPSIFPVTSLAVRGEMKLGEHRLVGSRADDARGLAGWLRFGVADTRFNRIGRYLGGGLVHTGITPSRPDDQVGVSVASAGFGDRYRRDHAVDDGDRDARDVVIETVYNAVLTDWLSVQPDLQYVVNPGGDPLRKDAFVMGLRVKIGRWVRDQQGKMFHRS